MSIMFEPVTIKNLHLRNRIARSATYEGFGNSKGEATEKHAQLYNTLAESGVGLIFTSAAMVKRFPMQLPDVEGMSFPTFLDSDELIGPWKPIVESVQSHGAAIVMQLVHPGRQEAPPLRLGEPPLAPSAIEEKSTGVVPRAMTAEEIEEMIDCFAHACRRSKEAGFDGAQLHGGHGYMISNFISPYTNRRDDEYGGDTARRSRFLVEIIRRARGLVGDDFALMIKMNCDDFVEGGLEKEEAVAIAAIIEEAGIDCIEITAGIYESRDQTSRKGINKREKEAYLRPYAEALRSAVSVPLILVGGMRSPDVIEEILSKGVADMVSLSRPFIREPELLKRWKAGDTTKATCISCSQCADNVFARPMRCYVEEAKRKKEEEKRQREKEQSGDAG